MKLKNSRNLDSRQSLLLESAFYAARPPERTAARRKQRPPLREYMRHLVHERLTHAELKQARLVMDFVFWCFCERGHLQLAQMQCKSSCADSLLAHGCAPYFKQEVPSGRDQVMPKHVLVCCVAGGAQAAALAVGGQ